MGQSFTTVFALTLLLVTAQAGAWTNSQEAANRLGAANVKELTYPKDSSSLTETQKSELRAAMTEASQKGAIDEVKILAWSDKEYPAKKGKQSKGDINLASSRIRDLKAFLKDELKVSSVDSYNMSERPNALQKLFHTSDEKVKNMAVTTGAAPTAGNTGLFDAKAQASKSIVMIFMKK